MSRETWELIKHMETEGLEVQMIIQCAPVIAGLKVSNLLIIPEGQLFQLRELLKDSSISMYLLLKEEGRLVILLYHREWLQRMLGEPDRKAWLVKAGYKADYDSVRAGDEGISLSAVLARFRRRYQSYSRGMKDFPHEMGILLGYPVEDVEGFILHKGGSYLCNGYWKVYYNVSQKQRTFRWYSFAEHHLFCLLKEGRSIPEIIRLYQRPLGIVPA